jgi:hypothetical protein
MARPLQCKAIASARLKNDKAGAATLAQLLRAGLLPEARVRPAAGAPAAGAAAAPGAGAAAGGDEVGRGPEVPVHRGPVHLCRVLRCGACGDALERVHEGGHGDFRPVADTEADVVGFPLNSLSSASKSSAETTCLPRL